jgi:hypothetical protein
MTRRGPVPPPDAERAARLRLLVAERRERVKAYRAAKDASADASRTLAEACIQIMRATPSTVRALANEAGIPEQELRTMLHRYFPEEMAKGFHHKELP